MTMDEPESTGRKPRVGESGAPVGSVLSIVLAVVAVVIGFVILRQINDDSGDAANGAGNGGGPAAAGNNGGGNNDGGGDTTQPAPTTTAAPAFQPVFQGANVTVVNSNQRGGSAGDMSEKLGGVGFTMGEPATGVGNQELLQKSRIFINPNNGKARAVARTVARSFNVRVPIQQSRAVDVININGQSETINGPVVLMMGTDLLNKNPTAPTPG